MEAYSSNTLLMTYADSERSGIGRITGAASSIEDSLNGNVVFQNDETIGNNTKEEKLGGVTAYAAAAKNTTPAVLDLLLWLNECSEWDNETIYGTTPLIRRYTLTIRLAKQPTG